MKKTVISVMMLAVMTVFFCSSVFAATPVQVTSKSSSRQVSSVTATLNASQYGVTAESYFQAGGAYTPIVVTLQLNNNNNTAALVDSLRFQLNFASTPFVLDSSSYSADLMIGHYTGSTFNVVPSAQFSYGNGIVVPPKDTLYLTAIVYVEANFNSTNNTFSAEPLTSVAITAFTVGLSDSYPYGTPVDMSGVISSINNLSQYVDNIEGYVDGIEGYVDGIEGYLSSILSALNFNGTIDSPTESTWLQQYAVFDTTLDDTTFTYRYYYYRLGSYSFSDEVSAIGNNGNGYHSGTRVIPYTIMVRTQSDSDLKFTTDYLATPYYFPKVTGVSYEIVNVVSSIFDGASIRATDQDDKIRIQLHFASNDAGLGIFSKGNYYSYIYVNMYCPYNYVPVFPASSTWTLPESPSFSILYDSLQAGNSANENLESMIHSQEEAYYQQNETNIENTGLTNYRFSDGGNGIRAVSTDFTSIWNALGSWTSVYIFSLTLGLALTIIRHTPKAVSSVSNRKRREAYANSRKSKGGP